MRPLPLVIVLALASAHAQSGVPTDAPFTVRVETPDGDPIEGASVLVGSDGASTGRDGRAVFGGRVEGRYPLRVSFVGRETQEATVVLDGRGPWELVVELGDVAGALGGVEVVARDLSRSWLGQEGFFRRADRGRGTFLDADDVARKAAFGLDGVLIGERRIVVQRRPEGWQAAVMGRGRMCRPPVYLDGVLAVWLTEDLSLLPASQVAAVEIYHNQAEVPFQFGGGRACGAILVWTTFSLEDAD